ncbi:Small protein B [Phytophthora cactorum]|nr:Small protein B [Phytophthora cactorum]
MELLTRGSRLPFAVRSTPWLSGSCRSLRDFPIKILCRNQKFVRKAAGNYYEVEREWNLGIVLKPSEVKSLRDRNADLSTAFGAFYKYELFLHDLNIPVWRQGLIGRPEPTRVRKLLANRSELKKLEEFANRPNAQLVKTEELSILSVGGKLTRHVWQIPMRIEVGNTGWIKVIMAACFKRGQIDNRRRDDEREIKRQLRDW